MVELQQLWLPILLSAAGVFVVSSLLHMLIPLHKGDHRPLPDEEGMRAALRAQGVPPGQYMVPSVTSMKDMHSPETVRKYVEGPVAMLLVRPNGPPRLGAALLQWFVLSLVVSVLVAYAATIALHRGAAGIDVLRLTATAAILAYAAGTVTDSIFKGLPWSTTAKFIFDGVVYGLVTGAVFAWLWPAAA